MTKVRGSELRLPQHPRTRARGREGRRESRAFRIAVYLVLLFGGIPIVIPIYWLTLASLKTKERLSVSPPDWLPVLPRSFVTIDGQEVQVVVFDDARSSGTGVARVRLAQQGGPRLRMPRDALRAERVDEYYLTEVDSPVRRRVRVLGPLEGPSGERVEVELLDVPREAEVPATAVREEKLRQVFWSVLGVEFPVRCAAWPLPAEGAVRVWWEGRSPAILVASGLVAEARDGLSQPTDDRARAAPEAARVTVHVGERVLPAERLAQNEAAGYVTIALLCPAEGVEVDVGALRAVEQTQHYIETPEGREPLIVRARDDERGAAKVEFTRQPQRRRVARERIVHDVKTAYFARVLGEERAVEPLERDSRWEDRNSAEGAREDSRPSEESRSGEPGPRDRAAALIEVHVPGAIAIAADRVRSEAPLAPQWHNYAAAWKEQTFGVYVVNTLLIASLVVLGTVLSCGLVGYAFSRLEFRGRDALFLVLLATMMVPGQVTTIPTFVIFAKLGWLDSFKPLIVPHFFAYSAFFVFLFRQFMMTIPTDLEDSARIDGCGPLTTWWLILMPLSRPIIVTVAVFSFLGVWNDLLGPLLYINSDIKQTVALGLQSLKGATFTGEKSELVMAATVMTIIPSVVLFFIAQKAFIRGVVVTGVKG